MCVRSESSCKAATSHLPALKRHRGSGRVLAEKLAARLFFGQPAEKEIMYTPKLTLGIPLGCGSSLKLAKGNHSTRSHQFQWCFLVATLVMNVVRATTITAPVVEKKSGECFVKSKYMEIGFHAVCI